MDDYKSYIYPRNDIFCVSRTNKHEKSDQVEKRNRGEHFWRDNENSPLLHTWRGRVVNLCEMKFVNTEFEVKNDYEMKLRERLNWVKYGIHCGIFQRVVTLDSLFEH